MAGGSFRSPLFVVAWPTGELGGMGLEGAVRLGFRREGRLVEGDRFKGEWSTLRIYAVLEREWPKRPGAI